MSDTASLLCESFRRILSCSIFPFTCLRSFHLHFLFTNRSYLPLKSMPSPFTSSRASFHLFKTLLFLILQHTTDNCPTNFKLPLFLLFYSFSGIILPVSFVVLLCHPALSCLILSYPCAALSYLAQFQVLRQSPFDACLQILSGSKSNFDERYNAFFIDYSLLPLVSASVLFAYPPNIMFRSFFSLACFSAISINDVSVCKCISQRVNQ